MLCFFVTGSEQNHDMIRALVLSHMQGPYDATLKSMYLNDVGGTKIGDWATDAEVYGAASMLNVNIHVYGANLKLWHLFVSLTSVILIYL
jgi:hypothetical protein